MARALPFNSTSTVQVNKICYRNAFLQLISDLRRVQQRWEQYVHHLEGPVHMTRPDLLFGGRPGRPRFIVDKAQIEYLASLSFKWTEIASILRMTLYRYDAREYVFS